MNTDALCTPTSSAALPDSSASIRPLSLSSLSLTCFRSYESVRLEISPAPVVLTGANGVGKTNILEAISLLIPGRGLRRAKLSELDNCRATYAPWTVAARITGRAGEALIGTGRDAEMNDDVDKRIVKIDGKLVRSQSELARHLSIIWLTPQMEQLFLEGTSAGRKFLDRLVYSFDAEHASRVADYEYAMRERNKLLQYGRADEHWLATLEATMSQTGAAIASARITTCEHINHMITASTLSFPKAHVDVSGTLEDLLKSGATAVAAEHELAQQLARGRNTDAASGRALIGPHRSELRVTHIAKNMPAESCSTGEQKALMLSIILAQARSGAQWHGVVPVILLDEVAGHLDANRRLELFEEICQIGAQVWMTGTDATLFTGLQGEAQFLQVADGRVFEE
jgi:DNA replication and repair protein RecF